MGCILAIITLLAPRVVMVFIFLLTDWFSRAYETVLWPVLGFIFMPYLTMAYMAMKLAPWRDDRLVAGAGDRRGRS